MTYPVDDAGNVRVDFVWGHMPMQPDQQRVNTGGEGENITTDGNWTVIKETGSSTLTDSWDSLSFPTGDGGGERYQTFEWGNHDMITEGYSNYPSFIANYAGDGDIGLEAVVPDLASFAVSAMDDAVVAAGLVYASTTTYVGATTVNDGKIKTQSPAAGVKANIGATVTATFYNAPEVPNVVGLTESAANTALVNAHVVKGAVTTANNAAGATALNDGKIKTQTPAAGTTVNTGSSVALVKYAYVEASHPIAAVTNEDFALGANEAWMYLLGRLVKPTVGDFITISGNGGDQFNSNNYEVLSVANDDAFNTGGTKVKLHCVTGTLAITVTGFNGTWAIAG
jgi:hypothetical protein